MNELAKMIVARNTKNVEEAEVRHDGVGREAADLGQGRASRHLIGKTMQAVIGSEGQGLQHQDETEDAQKDAHEPQPQQSAAALRPVVPQVDDEQC